MGSEGSRFVLAFLCVVRSPRGLEFGELVARWRGYRGWLWGLFAPEMCVCVCASVGVGVFMWVGWSVFGLSPS